MDYREELREAIRHEISSIGRVDGSINRALNEIPDFQVVEVGYNTKIAIMDLIAIHNLLYNIEDPYVKKYMASLYATAAVYNLGDLIIKELVDNERIEYSTVSMVINSSKREPFSDEYAFTFVSPYYVTDVKPLIRTLYNVIKENRKDVENVMVIMVYAEQV